VTVPNPGPAPDPRPSESGADEGGGTIRVAAVGDLHLGREGQGMSRSVLSRLMSEAEDQADLLLLCGDLTSHGLPEEIREVADALGALTIPSVAVLGNHDFEAGSQAEISRLLSDRGVHVLDGDAVELLGIGIAGVKGFAGGFGRSSLTAFGEPMIKQFVQEALDEALKLENALRRVSAPVKIAIMHYAPIPDTLAGEPPEIMSFLGSSRLLPPIEAMGVDVIFHGHAHIGVLEGRTPGGIPVFNVAYPVLQTHGKLFHVWETTGTVAGGA